MTAQPFPFLHKDVVPWRQYYCKSSVDKGAIPLLSLPASILNGITSGTVRIAKYATGQQISGYDPTGSISTWTDPDTNEVIYYYTGGNFPGVQAGQTAPLAPGELAYAFIGDYFSPLFYRANGFPNDCKPVEIEGRSTKRVGNYPPNVRMRINLDGRHGKSTYPVTDEVAETGDQSGVLLSRLVQKEWTLEALATEATLDALAMVSTFETIKFEDHRGVSYDIDPVGYSFGNPSWNQDGCLGAMTVNMVIASSRTANC